VVIDATNSDFIDHDVQELIADFKDTVAPQKQIQLNLVGMKDEYVLNDNLEFLTFIDKETQSKMTPVEVVELLKRGNERFVKGQTTEKYFRHQVNATSEGQHPMAVVLSCIDSRTSAELVFDAGMGDLFSIRVAGNIINNDILGSMEFACKVAGSKVIVVLGHTKCGAVNGACSKLQMGHITGLLHKLKPAFDLTMRNLDDLEITPQVVNEVAKTNVNLTMRLIREQSSILNEMVENGEISIVGGMYDVESGKIAFYEPNGQNNGYDRMEAVGAHAQSLANEDKL
jgi:carbonic anhydrase